MRGYSGKSSYRPIGINELGVHLVLCSLRGESSDFFNAGAHLHPYLVLPGAQEDSAQMPEEIRPQRPELVLCNVPGEIGKGPRQRKRLKRRPFFLLYSPTLEPAGREVVRVMTRPSSLRTSVTCRLARPRRTRTLSSADPSVRHKPPPTDTARPLLDHPQIVGCDVKKVDPVSLRAGSQPKVGNFSRAEAG